MRDENTNTDGTEKKALAAARRRILSRVRRRNKGLSARHAKLFAHTDDAQQVDQAVLKALYMDALRNLGDYMGITVEPAAAVHPVVGELTQVAIPTGALVEIRLATRVAKSLVDGIVAERYPGMGEAYGDASTRQEAGAWLGVFPVAPCGDDPENALAQSFGSALEALFRITRGLAAIEAVCVVLDTHHEQAAIEQGLAQLDGELTVEDILKHADANV